MPVTIRHQGPATAIKPAGALANSAIQLVPISSGNTRPSLVQPARPTLKATGLRGAAPAHVDPSAAVRVTLIQSPATITKITSTQPTAIASKPTIVGTVRTFI